MIMAHGDDKGLVLPPRVAPTQVVFVPIHYKESDKTVILETAHHIADSLGKHSIRTYIDDREQYTPGWKYHEWEMKGVPLRVEIGPRDMESKQITLVRRDTGKKTAVPQADSVAQIVNTLDEIQQSLLHKAKETQAKLTTTANNMKEFAHIIETTGGFVKAFLSEDNDCEERIKLETGATVRIVPFTESTKGQCVFCGAPDSRQVVFARSY
jgi:prolyl-tRNA synthetase